MRPRVVTTAGLFSRITLVLHDLHWLPVRQRVPLKLAMTVNKSLNWSVPAYLADDCVTVTSMAGRGQLRSADTRMLVVQRTRTILSVRD